MTTVELCWCLHGDATTYKRFEFIVVADSQVEKNWWKTLRN